MMNIVHRFSEDLTHANNAVLHLGNMCHVALAQFSLIRETDIMQ